jgi:hypothetical protein
MMAFAPQEIANSNLVSAMETVETGGSPMIEVRHFTMGRNAGEGHIPKAETRHFCLMPREMTDRVLPLGVAAG